MTELNSLKTISKLEIPIDKINYDKKEKRFAVDIFGFTFIGHYKKNTTISEILDDIHTSLKDIQVDRENIFIVDPNTNLPIYETTKLKELELIEKEKEEEEQKEKKDERGETFQQYLEDKKKPEKLIIKTTETLEEAKEDLERVYQKFDELKEGEQGITEFPQISDKEKEKVVYKIPPPSDQPTKTSSGAPPAERPPGGPPRGPPRGPPGGPPKGPPPAGGPPPTGGSPKVSSLRAPIMSELKSLFKRGGGAAAPSTSAAPPTSVSTPPTSGPPPPSSGPSPQKSERQRKQEPSFAVAPKSESSIKRDIAEEVSESEADVGEIAAVQPTTYDINMGLQYYPVMMEKQSYLFYVYFSHEELKIEDEEGKTVYETTFQIVTTKPEPPKLDLRIEGEGFEIHPLSGKIEVKKDAVNPPLMIFSILALKSKKKIPKKERKRGEKRYLHVYVDFENKNVSHTVLSIMIQPKHFSLDLGPIHINLSKTQAMLVCLISIGITVASLVYSILSIDISAPSGDTIGGILPGAGSFIFLVTFLITLLTKGVFPLKKKVSGFLDFDKALMLK